MTGIEEDEDEGEGELLDDSVVELGLGDVLDLHGFPPRDMAEIVRGYLDDACAAGFKAVRIVHGRGIGVQREMVRRLLASDPRVISFADAPGEHGGRGATVIELR